MRNTNSNDFKVEELEQRLEMRSWGISNDPCGMSVDPDCAEK